MPRTRRGLDLEPTAPRPAQVSRAPSAPPSGLPQVMGVGAGQHGIHKAAGGRQQLPAAPCVNLGSCLQEGLRGRQTKSKRRICCCSLSDLEQALHLLGPRVCTCEMKMILTPVSWMLGACDDRGYVEQGTRSDPRPSLLPCPPFPFPNYFLHLNTARHPVSIQSALRVRHLLQTDHLGGFPPSPLICSSAPGQREKALSYQNPIITLLPCSRVCCRSLVTPT